MAAPSKKPNPKGLPPQPAQSAYVVGNNTSKPESGAKVPCNFRVDPEFKKRLKVFSAAHDMDMVEVFEQAVSEFIDRKGGA
ncbi:hypothetical protein [Halomonas sp. 707B3]|uniref:hypothetical protein n=1 Tax=Halomonas sp. 707B3 TaxID=1681043 RepID=UPI00209D8904|nr:hypothetical protein [Halomonas sp. 707B3]MCP1317859.1 hypothetical protein [Halomonas sp. 707B3]